MDFVSLMSTKTIKTTEKSFRGNNNQNNICGVSISMTIPMSKS